MALWREPALALSFLTVLPAPSVPYTAQSLGRAARWFPLVGLLIGALLALAFQLLSLLFPRGLAAAGTVALWAALTGGLHLDGLADCCDGLLAPVDTERRLEIMRDPRLGTFAVVGLVLFLLLKSAALAASTAPAAALLLAPTWARWLLLPAARQPPARPGGLGAALAAEVKLPVLAVGLAAPILLHLAVGRGGRGLIAAAAAAAVSLLAIAVARRRLGGVTGDVFGLIVETSELAILLVYAAAP